MNIRYSKGVFMIREEDRGKVVSYLRKRGATVVLWIPSRKEKSSWSYRSLKYLFNTTAIYPHRKLSFLAQTFCNFYCWVHWLVNL
ncbi:MAG: hypothetical protein QW606_05365 [Conexivisphaerales archaeon]